MGAVKTKEQWEELVSGFLRSGMTQAAWCRSHGVKPKTFANHLYKHRKGHGYPRRTSAEWRLLISKFEESGQKMSSWCWENRVNEDSMRSATRRLAAAGAEGKSLPAAPPGRKFVMAVSEGAAGMDGTVRIGCGGIVIEADSGYPPDLLAALIGKVRAI